jgi:thioredoxin 1
MLEQLSKSSFEEKVLDAAEKVGVLFHAPWAFPSVEMFLKLKQYPVYQVDIEETPEVAAILALKAVPTLMIFEGGNILTFKVGLMSDSAIAEYMAQEGFLEES